MQIGSVHFRVLYLGVSNVSVMSAMGLVRMRSFFHEICWIMEMIHFRIRSRRVASISRQLVNRPGVQTGVICPKSLLAGGFKHVFSIIYGMSSFPLTFIFFRGVGIPPFGCPRSTADIPSISPGFSVHGLGWRHLGAGCLLPSGHGHGRWCASGGADSGARGKCQWRLREAREGRMGCPRIGEPMMKLSWNCKTIFRETALELNHPSIWMLDPSQWHEFGQQRCSAIAIDTYRHLWNCRCYTKTKKPIHFGGPKSHWRRRFFN